MAKQAHKQIGWLARDQYGNVHEIFSTNYPRAWLMEYYSVRSARKIYRDRKDGSMRHVGWIVAGHWFSVFRLCSLERG